VRPAQRRRGVLASGAAPGQQRGIALLTAILIVAVGTMLAAAMAWQNAMTARRAEATFALDQSVLIAQAGEALAGYALRESLKGVQQVYPGQPWSMPYGPVEVIPGVSLQAQLEDITGRFNLNRLVKNDGTIDEGAVAKFQQLLQILGLETKWADLIADWIDYDSVAQEDGAEDSTYLGQNPPYRTANRYITSPSELLALPGFGRDRYLALAPYVAALPYDALVNVCSASGPVLDALGPPGQRQFSTMGAQALAKERASANGCFPTKAEFFASFNDQNAQGQSGTYVSEASNYFRLTSIISVGTIQFALYSLLDRADPAHLRVIQRSFTAD
jgi:general secretion pathway protein K